jgi:hypothetical protein
VHPWFNFILRPVFSLPKPAQVTSVVLFNIVPVTPNRINGLFDSVRKPNPIPSVFITFCPCVCLLLQDLVQRCLHGGGGGYGPLIKEFSRLSF